MRMTHLLSVAALGCLLSGSVFAQTTPADEPQDPTTTDPQEARWICIAQADGYSNQFIGYGDDRDDAHDQAKQQCQQYFAGYGIYASCHVHGNCYRHHGHHHHHAEGTK